MKKTNIILISFITLLILAIVGITIATATNALNWSFSFGNIILGNSIKSGPVELIQTEHFDDQAITTLDLESVSANVIFSESADTAIHIRYFASKNTDMLEIKQNGSTVTLREPNKFTIGINISLSQSRIEVAIPKRQYASIKVATTSGAITLKELLSNRVILNSVSGSIDGEAIRSETLLASTTSGNIQLNSVSGAVKTDSISGAIKATQLIGSMQAKTTSGSIIVESFTMNESSNFSSISGSVTLTGLNTNTVPSAELSSISGKISSTIPFNGARTPLHISIETMSGRITIDE